MHSRRLLPFGSLVAACLATACSGGADRNGDGADREPDGAAKPRVVLIGIDGADADVTRRLIELHKLPHLALMMKKGASSPLSTLHRQPLGTATMQWTSLATGQPPERHGILVDYVHVPDVSGYTGPVQSGMRKEPAIWDVLGDQGARVGVVGWPATWPAEPINGYMATHYRKIRPTPFFHRASILARRLQLTTTGTIYANASLDQAYPASFYHEIAPIIEDKQRIEKDEIFRLLPSLANASPQIQHDMKWNVIANEIITGIAVHLLSNKGLDFVALVQHGIDVAFHRARRIISQDPFVASTPRLLPEYYEYVDSKLGELMKYCTEDTVLIIVSEHGTSGASHIRTPIDGILLMKGRGVRRGVRINAPSLVDIFPTILYIYDIPVPSDLDGRVLIEVFTEEFQQTRQLRYAEAQGSSRVPPPISARFRLFDGEVVRRVERSMKTAPVH